jgi:diguanylate cyclase (GGDEF)-like protein
MPHSDSPTKTDILITVEDGVYLRHCIDDVLLWLANDVESPIQRALRVVIPPQILNFRAQLNDLIPRIYYRSEPFSLSEADLSILRRALLHRRRAYVADNEALRVKTSSGDILEQLQARLEPIERMMNEDWFKSGKPCRLPRLTDFLSIQEAYLQRTDALAQLPLLFDEKFGILRSPSQFLPNLTLARLEAELRGTCVSVAFIDIDDFKAFNAEFGEFIVDKSVLPVFMNCMEAHVNSHGSAYRFGGDEYMFLLPNCPHESAVASCKDFQTKLPDLVFQGITKHLTVSIGLCTSGPDSPLTDRELQQRATDAKQVAKKAGKNCIAWKDGDILGELERFRIKCIHIRTKRCSFRIRIA